MLGIDDECENIWSCGIFPYFQPTDQEKRESLIFSGNTYDELIALRKPQYLQKVFFDYPEFIWFHEHQPEQKTVSAFFDYGIKLIHLKRLWQISNLIAQNPETNFYVIVMENKLDQAMELLDKFEKLQIIAYKMCVPAVMLHIFGNENQKRVYAAFNIY